MRQTVFILTGKASKVFLIIKNMAYLFPNKTLGELINEIHSSN